MVCATQRTAMHLYVMYFRNTVSPCYPSLIGYLKATGMEVLNRVIKLQFVVGELYN